MKTRFLTTIGVALVLFAGMSSCIDDESSLGFNTVPELIIAGSEAETMPAKNFNLGDECVIIPDITYQGGDEANLQYEWSIGTYDVAGNQKGNLEVVSHERDLHYNFTSGGTYYAHLSVTDGRVGQVMEYRININRTFEEGYVLVSNDEAGKPNLVFVKTMTPEEISAGIEQIRMDHCLERMNEGYEFGTLVNSMVASVTWPTQITRMLVSVEDKCYAVDPNTFTVIVEMNYRDVVPDFSGDMFINCSSGGPCAYDAQSRKYVHLDLTYMFPYEYGTYKGNGFEDIFVDERSMWGSVYAFNIFVDYSTSTVALTDMNTGQFPSKMLDDNILSAFQMDDGSGQIYVLASGKQYPNQLSLYGIKNSFDYASFTAKLEQVSKSSLTATDNMAVPVQGARVCVSQTQHRFFYPIDNKVYVLLAQNGNLSLPAKSEYAISFDDDEEITFMKLNAPTDELYVATYNKITKRGSFYIYDAADIKTDNQGNIRPKASHPACADKIISVHYKQRV